MEIKEYLKLKYNHEIWIVTDDLNVEKRYISLDYIDKTIPMIYVNVEPDLTFGTHSELIEDVHRCFLTKLEALEKAFELTDTEHKLAKENAQKLWSKYERLWGDIKWEKHLESERRRIKS